MNTSRFQLPDEAVDGFVLQAWQADTSPYVDCGARSLRYVYRLKCTWADVFPDWDESPGADFEDEWQVYDGERFTGRYMTWFGPLKYLNGDHSLFPTRREAQEHTMKYLRGRIEEYQEVLSGAQELLTKIEAELGAASEAT